MKFVPVLLALLVCLSSLAAQFVTPRVSQLVPGTHALAIDACGTVWSWGDNPSGQLGTGNTLSHYTPNQLPVMSSYYPSPARACATGYGWSMLLAADHTVWVWGGQNNGALATGLTSGPGVTSPIQIPGLNGVVAIAAGAGSGFALLGDGTVRAWGGNYSGQVGANSPSNVVLYPTTVLKDTNGTVSPLTDVIAISAGVSHSLALLSTGEVYSWGTDFFGELGDGNSLGNYSSPGTRAATKIPNISGAVAIAAGQNCSFVVLANGSVLAFGAGSYGQLGTGTTAQTNATPAHVLGVSGVIAASGGERHALFLNATGTVYGCGSNADYRLGLPNPAANYAMTALTGLNACVSITAGKLISWAVGVDGQARACGTGSLLGQGSSPVQAFALVNGLPMNCSGNYGLQLTGASGGLQMAIPANGSTNLFLNNAIMFYANVYSMDPANGGPQAGMGNWCGLHVSPAELDLHINLALAGCDMVFGQLEPSGGASAMLPIYGGILSGTTIWGVSIAIDPVVNSVAGQSMVASTTL